MCVCVNMSKEYPFEKFMFFDHSHIFSLILIRSFSYNVILSMNNKQRKIYYSASRHFERRYAKELVTSAACILL
jgi:hypothetical protein